VLIGDQRGEVLVQDHDLLEMIESVGPAQPRTFDSSRDEATPHLWYWKGSTS